MRSVELGPQAHREIGCWNHAPAVAHRVAGRHFLEHHEPDLGRRERGPGRIHVHDDAAHAVLCVHEQCVGAPSRRGAGHGVEPGAHGAAQRLAQQRDQLVRQLAAGQPQVAACASGIVHDPALGIDQNAGRRIALEQGEMQHASVGQHSIRFGGLHVGIVPVGGW